MIAEIKEYPSLDQYQEKARLADKNLPLIIYAGPGNKLLCLLEVPVISLAFVSRFFFTSIGSGKTATLLARILHIREETNANCLVLTFSTNAVKEMKNRLKAALFERQHTFTGVEVLTYHGFSYRVIKRNFPRLGYKKAPVLCSARNAAKILIAVNSNGGSDYREFKKRAQEMVRLFRSAKKTGEPIDYLHMSHNASLIPTFKSFQAKLIESGFIEYGTQPPARIDFFLSVVSPLFTLSIHALIGS